MKYLSLQIKASCKSDSLHYPSKEVETCYQTREESGRIFAAHAFLPGKTSTIKYNKKRFSEKLTSLFGFISSSVQNHSFFRIFKTALLFHKHIFNPSLLFMPLRI